MNLDARTPIPESAPSWPTGADTNANWLATSDFATAVTVYDPLGRAHALIFLFARTTRDEWDYRVLVSDVDLNASGATDNLTGI